MKKQTVLLLIGLASLTIIALPVIMLFFLNPYNDDGVGFEWKDTCHGAEVAIILSTDSLWITSRKSYKITLIFGVDNINGSSNEVISYNNSYVVLNRIRLDPSYLNLSESPFKQLLDKQGWSIDWYITSNATDPLLRSMGITKGKRIDYSLHLSVNYTVIDSIGIEWPRMFQNYANVSIVGGSDAPQIDKQLLKKEYDKSLIYDIKSLFPYHASGFFLKSYKHFLSTTKIKRHLDYINRSQ